MQRYSVADEKENSVNVYSASYMYFLCTTTGSCAAREDMWIKKKK
jgi:hypothetical protein